MSDNVFALMTAQHPTSVIHLVHRSDVILYPMSSHVLAMIARSLYLDNNGHAMQWPVKASMTGREEIVKIVSPSRIAIGSFSIQLSSNCQCIRVQLGHAVQCGIDLENSCNVGLSMFKKQLHRVASESHEVLR